MLQYLLTGLIVLITMLLLHSIISFLFFKKHKTSVIFMVSLIVVEIISLSTLYFVFIHDNINSQKLNIEQLKNIDFDGITKSDLLKIFDDYIIEFNEENHPDSNLYEDQAIIILSDKLNYCTVLYYNTEAAAKAEFEYTKIYALKDDKNSIMERGVNNQYIISSIRKARDEWGISVGSYATVFIQSENVHIHIGISAESKEKIIKTNNEIIGDIFMKIQKLSDERSVDK